MFKDYYQILGVLPTASEQEIKEAYKKMSLRWHPDRNPGENVTHIMQDINEAYMILKDDVRRARYNNEYQKFARKHKNIDTVSPRTQSQSWNYNYNYNYEVDDEELKNDINDARKHAKDLVDEFLNSLKETSKKAAKGGWEGMKGYVYAAIILSVLGLCIRTCIGTQKNNEYAYNNRQTEPPVVKSSMVSSKTVTDAKDFQVPNTWTKYYIANKIFSLSVPSSVELRHEYDNYVKRLQNLGLLCNTEDIVFQQKDLADNSTEALAHYCRIIVQYNRGSEEDYPLAGETFPIDADVRADLRDIVDNELGQYKLIGEPSYKWISIRGAKAIETSYRRTGSDGHTTACKMYLLFNSDKMVKMMVSYREQESDIWLPDLANVVKTFRWEQ